MKLLKIILLFVGFVNISCAQVPEDRPTLLDEKFDARVTQLISFSVPVIGVEELHDNIQDFIILDAREKEEYDVSHIPGAVYVGYNKFNKKLLKEIPKDAKIVLYCSVGYRSEKIGKKLRKMGYTNAHNLFGSIFEWINRGYQVVDNENHPIFKVHTYNKKWSQWVDDNKAVKVW